MSISSEIRRAGPFAGNGSTVNFPFAFKVFTTAQVLVTRTVSGVETVLTLTTDYTVTLNADQNANPGGTVTMLSAPAVGQTITITSNLANLQPTALANLGGFYPEVINDSLDRATIQIQQLDERLDRALTIPVSSSGIDTELPPPESGKLIGWDSGGTALFNYVATTILPPKAAAIDALSYTAGDYIEATGANTFQTRRLFPTAAATDIANIANAINTTGKFEGQLVWDTTTKRMLRAAGSAAGDAWERVSGNQFDSPFYIVKTLGDLGNNYFATDLNRSTSPNTQHYQIYTMRGSDLQQNASQNFVRWYFRDDGVTGGAAYGSGRVAQRFDYYLRGEANTGFMVAQNINLSCSNLTGGVQLTNWITSMSPPSATLAAAYGLPGVTYGWTAGIVSCGEYNFGNRFADFGVLENVTSGRCVFGIFLVPDVTDTDDGISVGDVVASGEIYHAQFGLVVSKSTRGHKVYAPFHVAYDTIGPLGYGLLINGNQSSAVNQGSWILKAQGYFGSGIDMSGCTFSEAWAMRIPVGKRIRYSGTQFIGMEGTENGIFNGTASLKAEQNARVIITSASDVVIVGNLDIRNDIINATNDVLFTTEGGVRFPSYTSAQLQDITNAVNTSPVKVAGFTVFNTTLGLLCTAIGSNDNSPWSPSDGGTDLTPV